MEYLFPYLCCLIIGALGGFAGGFRVAALVLAKPSPAVYTPLRVVASDGEVLEDFA